MYQVKLFRNGNSTVMAIPVALSEIFNWKPGMTLCIHDYTPETKPEFKTMLIHRAEIEPQPIGTHARKATHKTR